MKQSDDNFKIGIKAKKLFADLYNLLENIPRKDFFLKEKVNNTTFALLETIYLANFCDGDCREYHIKIKSDLALIDALLEIMYRKKYISIKQLETESYLLKEITKMTSKWKINVVE